MKAINTGRKHKGQSIIEMIVGVAIMLPVLAALLDIGVMVMASTMNGDLAKNAARAAASAAAVAATDVSAAGLATAVAAQKAAFTTYGQNPTEQNRLTFVQDQAQVASTIAGLAAGSPPPTFTADQADAQKAYNDATSASATPVALNAIKWGASLAAQTVIGNFHTSGFISNPTLASFQFTSPSEAAQTGGCGVPNAQPGQVVVATTVTVNLPVPPPLAPAQYTLQAYSVQPIISMAPNFPGACAAGCGS